MQHGTWGLMTHSIQFGDYLHSTNYIRMPKEITGLESIMGELCWSMGETRVEGVRRARSPQQTVQGWSWSGLSTKGIIDSYNLIQLLLAFGDKRQTIQPRVDS